MNDMSIKPILSGTTIIIISLLVVSVLLTISIASNTLPLIHYQQALAERTTTMPNFLTYHNSTYGISVQYPSDWLYRGSENTSNADNNNNNSSGQVQTIAAFIPRDRSIHALVITGTVNLPPIFQSIRIDNMSSFASLVVDNIKQSSPGFQLIESKATTVKTVAAVGGSSNTLTIPAQKIVYTADGPVHNTMAVYAIKGDKAFFINYLTETESIYSNYLPIAQKMIDSFQILK
jgi:PsbP-like protein